MRFGIDISQHQLTWDELVSRARFAEDAGFDSAWVFDHFKPLYGDPKGPCLEGWTLLAALAARTERIRLGALVTGVTYRHPSVLTAEAVTVDHVSNGRLELGMGAAWFEQEHDALGIDFPAARDRIGELEDALNVMRLLMTEDDVSYEGTYHVLRAATYHPRPVQQPHPPFWIGGSGRELMLPLVGRHADVWHTFAPPPALAGMWDVVRRGAEAAGRDPERIARSHSLSISESWDEVRAAAEDRARAGVTYLIVSWPADRARIDEFAERVMPELRAL